MERQTPSPATASGALPAVLPADARLSDDEWPGVVVALSDDVRVAVNHKCNRYALQRRCWFEGKPAWAGPMYASATRLRAAAAKISPEIERGAASIPEKPGDALAGFRACAKAASDAWAARDITGHGFAWVLASFYRDDPHPLDLPELCEVDEWLRVIVAPNDHAIMVQMSVYGSTWSPVVHAETPAQLAKLLDQSRVPVTRDAFEALERCDEYAESWCDVLADGVLLGFIEGLPGEVEEMGLPDLPERPQPLHGPVRPSERAGPKLKLRAGRRPKASHKARRAGF